MTEKPFDNNPELEIPDPDAGEPAFAELTPPPLPSTGYETQVLTPEPDESPVEAESAVVITTPPVVPESPRELEIPSPFEQEQPEPITFSSSAVPESPVKPPVAPLPAAVPPSGGAPKKNNTLLIVIIVVAVLLLCCCCVIVGAIAMSWDQIRWDLGINLVQSLMHLVR